MGEFPHNDHGVKAPPKGIGEDMAHEHDTGEEVENDTRRDDHLEREFGTTGRDFVRGSDRNDQLFAEYLRDRELSRQRDAELFDARMSARRNIDSLTERRRERAEVSSDDRDGLRFRDAAIHSTAVGSLEGEIATVGDEEEENVPDEDNANTGVSA